MSEPYLASLQVGLPRTIVAGDGSDAPWTTGFYKSPVTGSVQVNATNLEGDGQADLSCHGGIDKAVLAYSAEHYIAWRNELSFSEMPYGAFGENLTITNQTEQNVCIGDQWSCGDVVFQISQPRQPCWKLARRWQLPGLPKLVVQSGRSGWYLRVLAEGEIEAGLNIDLIERPHADWTVQRANATMYGHDMLAQRQLASLPELSASWKSEIMQKVSD